MGRASSVISIHADFASRTVVVEDGGTFALFAQKTLPAVVRIPGKVLGLSDIRYNIGVWSSALAGSGEGHRNSPSGAGATRTYCMDSCPVGMKKK